MSKPNINIPAEFAINGTKTDFSQAKITNGFDRLQPDVLPGDNLNKFIDDTYKGLNGVLELFEGCVLYDAGTTYNNTSLVFAIINNNIKLYHSIQNDNTGNPLTDTDYWEEVNLGGGYEVGDVIWRLLPTQDSGKHLLDGALIDGNGSYAAFVTYIAGLVTNYPNLFVTEADWQSSVTTYGVCGKFVYDSTNNTVRLPKITGIIEGTIDLSALSELVEAGLPNITGSLSQPAGHPYSDISDLGSGSFSGAFWGTDSYTQVQQNANQYGTHISSFNLDASRSSSIYKNNFNKVQPQTINGFYYIVIATSTKTDIQVDIDQIATDLNGKADIDFANINDTATKSIVHNTRISDKYYQYTLGASGSTYTMLFDGELHFSCRAPSDSVNHVPYSYLQNNTQGFTIDGGSSYDIGWTIVMNVKKGDVVSAVYGNQATGQIGRLRLYACVGNESEVQ